MLGAFVQASAHLSSHVILARELRPRGNPGKSERDDLGEVENINEFLADSEFGFVW